MVCSSYACAYAYAGLCLCLCLCLEPALKTTKRVGKFIRKRQKLIKLADKSEEGWLAVDEYESDELTDDSADEKRIKKAQEKAARKK